MRNNLILAFLALFFAVPMLAQQSVTQNLASSGTACLSGGASPNCLAIGAQVGKTTSVSFTLSGTFSATAQFEGSADGGNSWSSLSANPSGGGAAVTSAAAPGIWSACTMALTNFRARLSAYASGPVTATIQTSIGSVASCGSSGGGSPTGSAGGDLGGTYPNPSVVALNGTNLAGLGTGIVKNTTGTGVPSIAVSGDFPTLNQNTTGTAANVSGTPALPNGTTATAQAVDDNTAKLATDAFVLAQAASANPLINGTATPGTSTRYARADHVHPTDTTRVPTTTTVAGHALSSNVTIACGDLSNSGTGCSGAAGDTTAQYLLAAADGTLTNARVIVTPDIPPASANALDDEFNGAALSGNWTTANFTGCSTAEGNGWLGVTCTNASTIKQQTIYQAAFGSTPQEFTAKMSWTAASWATTSYAGIMALESSTSKGVACMFGGTGNGVTAYSVTFTSTSNYNTNATSNSGITPAAIYVKLKDDGTNIICSYSTDGANFTQVASTAISGNYTTAPNKIALMINPQVGGLLIGYDWFRRTL